MPIPWLAALKAIPWAALLASAPAMARAANAVLSRDPRSSPSHATELQSLADRVTALEKNAQASAELLAQVTDQIQRLTTATEVLAARLRWLIVLGAVSSGFAVLALAMAWR